MASRRANNLWGEASSHSRRITSLHNPLEWWDSDAWTLIAVHGCRQQCWRNPGRPVNTCLQASLRLVIPHTHTHNEAFLLSNSLISYSITTRLVCRNSHFEVASLHRRKGPPMRRRPFTCLIPLFVDNISLISNALFSTFLFKYKDLQLPIRNAKSPHTLLFPLFSPFLAIHWEMNSHHSSATFMADAKSCLL